MEKEGAKDIEDGLSTTKPMMTSSTVEMEEVAPLIQDTNVPSASKDSTAASKRLKSSNSSSNNGKKSRKVKRLRKKPTPEQHGPLLKYGSLFLLVAQVVGLVLIMRYSRTHHSKNGGDLYLSSTAVFCMEVRTF